MLVITVATTPNAAPTPEIIAPRANNAAPAAATPAAILKTVTIRALFSRIHFTTVVMMCVVD